jgi:hypothetical protein
MNGLFSGGSKKPRFFEPRLNTLSEPDQSCNDRLMRDLRLHLSVF